MPAEGFVQVPGGRLWFQSTGVGPDVVLIHPGLWDSRTWDREVAALAGRYRVTRYDVRGYGRSTFPDAPYSNTEDVICLLEHLEIKRAALIGCSMGGNIAVRFAIEYPDRVTCLVAVAAGMSGWEWPEETWGPVWKAIQDALDRGDTEAATELALEVWAPLGTDDPVGQSIRRIALDNAQQFRLDEEDLEITGSPPLEHLHEISAPTLVVLGADDVAEIAAIGNTLQQRIPNARAVVIERADHVVNMRQPQAFNQVVGHFLDETLLVSV